MPTEKQKAQQSEADRTRAIFGHVLAHGLEPKGSELRPVRGLRRSLLARPLFNGPTEADLKSIPKRYQELWSFLADKQTKKLRKGSRLLDATYRRLGEVGEDCVTWWNNGARFAFAEKRVPAIYVDGEFVFEGRSEELVEPPFTLMRVFMTKTKTELIEEFRRALNDVHPGNRAVKAFRDKDSFGKHRVRPNDLKKALKVWRLKMAHPHMSFAQIGEELRGRKLSSTESSKDLGDTIRNHFNEAERLIGLWAGPQGTEMRSNAKRRRRGSKQRQS